MDVGESLCGETVGVRDSLEELSERFMQAARICVGVDDDLVDKVISGISKEVFDSDDDSDETDVDLHACDECGSFFLDCGHDWSYPFDSSDEEFYDSMPELEIDPDVQTCEKCGVFFLIKCPCTVNDTADLTDLDDMNADVEDKLNESTVDEVLEVDDVVNIDEELDEETSEIEHPEEIEDEDKEESKAGSTEEELDYDGLEPAELDNEEYEEEEKEFLSTELPEIEPEKLVWADVEFEEDELEYRMGFTGVEDSISDFACCPRCFFESPEEDIENLLKRSFFVMGSFSGLTKVECCLNVIRQSVYSMCHLQNHGLLSGVEGIMCADMFLRQRHENLSMMVAKILKLDEEKTDKKFSEVFDIDSDRTPDFIARIDESNYLIIEVTATSDVEKAAKGKGISALGYEPKYESEINMIKSLGHSVTYIVIVFDMSDTSNDSYKVQLQECASLLGLVGDLELLSIEFVRREYCTCSIPFNKLFGVHYSSLFNKNFSILSDSSSGWKCWIEEGKRWYETKYEQIKVNIYVYDKLVRNHDRLFSKLEHCFNTYKNENAELVYDSSRSTFNFRESNQGAPLTMWRTMFENENYDSICLMMKYRTSGVNTNIPKAELDYFQLVKDVKYKQHFNLQPFVAFHPTSYLAPVLDYASDQFESLYSEVTFGNFKYLDSNYEQKIIDSIKDMDSKIGCVSNYHKMFDGLKVKPFSAMKITKTMLVDAIEGYNREMESINNKGDIVKIVQSKQPFLYPLYKVSSGSYSNYKQTPTFLHDMLKVNIGPLTNRILSIASSSNFTFGGNKLAVDVNNPIRKEIAEISRKGISLQKQLFRDKGMKVFPKLIEVEGGVDMVNKLRELNDKLRKETANIKTEYSLIRLPTGKKHESHQAFVQEMSHFKIKDEMATLKGVGLTQDPNWAEDCYVRLKNVLLTTTGIDCPDPYYSDHVSFDSELLMDLKKKHVSDNSSFKKFLMGTFLYHSAAFVSRLCHTLMFLSQTPTGGDNFCIDNLGYDDVMLIVKGGKKVFSTKKSRLFRLIYPSFEANIDLHFPHGLKNSFQQVEVNSKSYIITPWINMHETLLTDGITFLHRVSGFITLNREGLTDYKEEINKSFFNVILSFHNRRKTESFLHNLRYITMNCMAIFSNVSDILKELAGFNYDCFQFYIRNCISKNFLGFAMKLKSLHDDSKNNFTSLLQERKLQHMFNGNLMSTVHDLANSVYSTYLMSKAPTTQVLEQYANFRDMVETHKMFKSLDTDIFDGKLDVTIDEFPDFPSYYEKLHENDFNYDPKFCVLIGKFMADYLNSTNGKSFFQSKWDQIINEPWDEFANTKGLRGWDSEFFGTKGYYVVYKDFLERNPENIVKLLEILRSDESQNRKKRLVDKLNESYRDILAKEHLDTAIFHVVDKKQRGGRREIFVMDLATKKQQQPIEKMCASICKVIPDEMISIPSNKRLSTIHSKVFEGQRTNGEHFYLVLDCRKWAPRSLVHKFVLFLSGMKHVLPNSFLIHCYSFLFKMTQKRLYTKPHIVNMIKKNKQIKDVDFEWFVGDDTRKGFYMEMNYSWMMGIFNYFSSLMHVANQMYAAHLLRITTNLSYESEFHLQMVAHSDDSAGKAVCKNEDHMRRGLFIYQTLLKSANHMLSMKKSNCGRAYYEFLSILYIGGTLLSLLAKFAGLFNFHPSDGGYCQDIAESYSKCIELFMNGATFEKCYIAFKIQTCLIRRFYFQNQEDTFLYNYPPSMMGIPDAHPLMVIACGSDADLVRIMYHNNKTNPDFNKKIMLLNNSLSVAGSSSEGFLRSFKAKPNVRMHKRLLELKETYDCGGLADDDLLWPITNVSFKNSTMNSIQFLRKLEDKIFLASLQDESLTRRMSRSYYFRSSASISTNYGPLSYKDLRKILAFFALDDLGEVDQLAEVCKDIMDRIKLEFEAFEPKLQLILFDFIHSETVKLYKYLDRLGFDESKIETNQKKTKPLKIMVKRSLEILEYKYSPQELATWIKYPEYRLLLPNTKNFSLIEHEVKQCLSKFNIMTDDISVDQLSNVLLRMSKKSDINIFCYSNVPATLREVTTYQDLLNLLAHNTFKDKYIKGIAVPFGKTIGVMSENVLDELSCPEVQWTLSYLLLMLALSKDKGFPILKNLKVNVPTVMGEGEVSMCDLIQYLQNYWEKEDPKIFNYIKVNLLIAKSVVFDEAIDSSILTDSYYHSFVKRQFLAQNVWLGVGQLFVSLGKIQICLLINNQKVSGVVVRDHEYHFSMDQDKYLNLVLKTAQLFGLRESMRTIELIESSHLFLGYDRNGNLSIEQGEALSIGIPAQVDYNLRTELSKPNSGRVSLSKGSKLKWSYNTESGTKSYTINTIIINSSDAINLLRGLIIDNDENKELMRNFPKSYALDIMQLIYKTLDVDLEIDRELFFENIHNTKIYKILKVCNEMKLCTVVVPKPRLKAFPAQDGGLLCTLIEYSKVDKDFDFNWDRVLTREYLNLKATQPEAFMTNLVSNLKQNFENLYEATDKTAILRELSKLAKIKRGVEFEETLFSMLCNWGYIGIAGALETTENLDISTSFRNIRVYRGDFPFIKFFVDSFVSLLIIIYHSTLNALAEIGCCAGRFSNWLPLTIDNFKFHFMSFIHAMTLKCYANRVTDDIDADSCSLYLTAFLETICSSEKGSTQFNSRLCSVPLLSNLVLNFDTLDEWIRCFFNLRGMWVEKNLKEGVFLDFTLKLQRLECETPFKITQGIIEQCGLRLEAASVYHHGVLGANYYKEMGRRYNGVNRNQRFRIISKIVGDMDEVESFDYNLNYWPPYPFSEEFMETDEFEDFKMEFEFQDMDVDTVNDMIENSEVPTYLREKAILTYLPPHSKEKSMLTINLTLMFSFGTSSNKYWLSKLRQSGMNFAFITDYLSFHLVNCKNYNFRFFRLLSSNWINKSILDPSSVFVTLCSNYGDDSLWEDYFRAKKLGVEEIELLMGVPSYFQVNSIGVYVDNRKAILYTMEESNEMLEMNLELLDRERAESGIHAETSGRSEIKRDEILKLMEDKGFKKEDVDIFLKEEKSDEEGSNKKLMNILTNLLNDQKFMESFKGEILSKSAELLKKPMSSREHEQILQVAPIFGSMVSKQSDLKNRVIDDKELLAELNSIAPSFLSKIVSNRLFIGKRLWQIVNTKVKTYRRLVKTLRKNVENKIFLLNLFNLIVNDTTIVTDPDEGDEKVLSEFSDWINEKFIDDEEDDEEEIDMFSRAGEGARMNYNPTFEPSRFNPKSMEIFFNKQ